MNAYLSKINRHDDVIMSGQRHEPGLAQARPGLSPWPDHGQAMICPLMLDDMG